MDETILYLWNELNRGGKLPFRRADLMDRLQRSYSAAYEKYGGWGSEKADAQRLEYLRNMPPVPPQFADKKILDLCGPQLDLRQRAAASRNAWTTRTPRVAKRGGSTRPSRGRLANTTRRPSSACTTTAPRN